MRRLLIGIMALTAFSARADILNVPSEFATIQMAIDAAGDGDEIVIAPGVYRELLNANNRSISMSGAGSDQTFISGDIDNDGTADGTLLYISNSESLVLSDLTIQDAVCAIQGSWVDSYALSRCRIIDSKDGLDLFQGFSPNISVDNCVFDNNTGNSAKISVGSNSTTIFSNCVFSNGYYGIEGEYITIDNCTFTNHTQIAVTGNDYIVRDCTFTSNNNTIGTDGDLVVENCHFENNTGDSFPSDGGAAIYHRSGNCTISNSTFVRNTTEGRWGGAIDFIGSVLSVTNSTFLDNKAGTEHSGNPFPYSYGGAIHADGFGIDIRDCHFEGNVSNGAGAVCLFTSGGDARVVNCVFLRNGRSTGPGGQGNRLVGGAFCNEGGRTLLENCEFRENSASQGGAVAAGLTGEINIRNCRFYANKAPDGQGGALAVDRADSVVSSIFIGNSARFCGAIGWNPINVSPSPDILNSVFVDNQATHRGSVLYFEDSEPLPLRNSIVVTQSRANNFLSNVFPSSQLYYPIPETNRLYINNSNGAGFARLPNHGGDGWGDDPATPNIDEGANDDFGDLRLTSASPCIDAGDNSAIPIDVNDIDGDGDTGEPITGLTDLNGNPRFIDIASIANAYPGNSFGGPIDLGPYEYQETICLPDVNGDGMVTPTDFTAWINAFNNNLPECDQNGDGNCTPTDFTAWINNFNAGCP